ncbi:MAG: protein meaA [Rhodospirillales bacterium]|nr:protein meaA [Rhodospirillales bacterium]
MPDNSKNNGEIAAKQHDRPWIFRTYAGHTSAEASNALFRGNLEKGQTGLSVAFDLPTQTGLDSDHLLARGEVGKVGVPIGHLGDMETLFADIPLDKMNTSMTINAPAPWLLALYVAVAEKNGVQRSALSGTVQNDVLKEYLSRGTYIFPPEPSLKLTADVVAFTTHEIPKWNPINVCSYHLQEAGATPEEELAFALANAIAVLDAVKANGSIAEEDFPKLVGRISFFVNAGIRFVTELCKMRAFTELWDEITAERYGVEDAKMRRFRYGVQVNSLGLTEQQPENNVYRILIEMLAVVLSKNARARAVQLPAWNEALGLPRPWDQQWSLRLQQIMAFESDLLEYGDLFDGSPEIEAKVAALKVEAKDELARIEEMGGSVAAIPYMKRRLVESNARRLAAIESGEKAVVGVNRFTEGEPSPLTATGDSFLSIDEDAETRQIESLNAWRNRRDNAQAKQALTGLEAAAREGRNLMEPSISCAHAGVTTGEWGQALREVYGEYRPPTGIANSKPASGSEELRGLHARVEAMVEKHGLRPRILIGKPGLDGHSNGAEQIAVRARDAGFEVIYEGIRLTPEQIVATAVEEHPHVIGLSVLSGSHLLLIRAVKAGMDAAGIGATPLVVGGIIPPGDADALYDAGVARIYTPKNFDMNTVMSDILDLVEEGMSGH